MSSIFNVEKVANLQRKDLYGHTIDWDLQDAEIEFKELFASGYVIYDVVAEGGFENLSTKTPGNYVCVWIGDPAGVYSIIASDFNIHTNVIILGLKLDSGLGIVQYNITISITYSDTVAWTNTDYIYWFKYININAYGSCTTYLARLAYESCNITFLNNSGESNILGFLTIKMTNVHVYYSNYMLTLGSGNVRDTELENVIIEEIQASNMSMFILQINNNGYRLSLKNVLVQNIHHAEVNFQKVGGGLIRFETINTYITNCKIVYQYTNPYIGNLYGIQYIYVSNNTLGTSLSTRNLIFVEIIKSNITAELIGSYQSVTLASNLFTTTTGYITRAVKIKHSKDSFRGSLGIIKHNFYNINYLPTKKISESLKYYDDYDIEIRWRYDIEAEFTVLEIAKIKNKEFYKSNGTTLVSTYRKSESFLIYCEDNATAGSYAMFAFHMGHICLTLWCSNKVSFNSVWNILRVVNIREFPEKVDFSTTQDITNGPVEMDILMEDITHKVIKP